LLSGNHFIGIGEILYFTLTYLLYVLTLYLTGI